MNNKKLRQINTLIREANQLKREYESSMRILERRKSDLEHQEATTTFIENHVIKPFNELENHEELKTLISQTIEKTLEMALEKLKEKGDKK